MSASRHKTILLRCGVFVVVAASGCIAQRVAVWAVSHDMDRRLGSWLSLPIQALWALGFFPVLLGSVFLGWVAALLVRHSRQEATR